MVIVCFVAFFSTTAFIILWFWVVRKEMKAKLNTVECAKKQLVVSQMQCLKARDAPEVKKAQEIFERSLDIYNQSISIYNKNLYKFWNIVPAIMLGFTAVNGDI